MHILVIQDSERHISFILCRNGRCLSSSSLLILCWGRNFPHVNSFKCQKSNVESKVLLLAGKTTSLNLWWNFSNESNSNDNLDLNSFAICAHSAFHENDQSTKFGDVMAPSQLIITEIYRVFECLPRVFCIDRSQNPSNAIWHIITNWCCSSQVDERHHRRLYPDTVSKPRHQFATV